MTLFHFYSNAFCYLVNLFVYHPFFFTDMEDNCTWEFTTGQVDKMERNVKQYKPTLMENIYSKGMVNKCVDRGSGLEHKSPFGFTLYQYHTGLNSIIIVCPEKVLRLGTFADSFPTMSEIWEGVGGGGGHVKEWAPMKCSIRAKIFSY